MNLVVVSHKESWKDPNSPSGYCTVGGFPFQMRAISEIFEETQLVITLKDTSPPPGAMALTGNNLIISPLKEPKGRDTNRKLHLPLWFLRNLQELWHQIKKADAVHALVPGDVGFIGLILAYIQQKPLFIRHCGTWGSPVTIWDKILFWVIEHIAGGKTVTFATGGGLNPPSVKNPNIKWVHSTSLTEEQLNSIKTAKPWKPGETLRLVTVARLSKGKNIKTVIESIPLLLLQGLDIRLDVIGDGPEKASLVSLSEALNITEQVFVLGNIPHSDVLNILSKSHLFVFPTLVKEGFPKAVLEAMACGLPVIATEVSVLPKLLGNGRGILLHKTDAQELSKVISDIITDPSRMARMGKKAHEAAKAYSLEKWRDLIKSELERAWKIPLS